MGIGGINIALYLNLAFFAALGIGVIFGLIKGFRRSLYTFIITVIFIGLFFLTVNIAVNSIYNANFNFLGGLLGRVSPILNDVTTLKEAVRIFLFDMIGDKLNTSYTNPDFLAFVDAIGAFAIKIVYTILYFTVIQIVYRFILFIVGLIIFRKGRAKNKKGKRGRVLGGVFGGLVAAINLFVMIIVLSGIISIADSLTALQADPQSYQISLDRHERSNIINLDQSLNRVGKQNYLELADTNAQLTDALKEITSLVDSYNNNIFIQVVNSVKITDEVTGEVKNPATYLFDEVLSINHKEDKIALREDLRTFSKLAGIYLNSDYYASNNLSDIKSTEVTDLFTILSKSKLVTTLIPIAIEAGIDYFDVDIVIEKQLLYTDIKWKDEIEQIGVVATVAFVILESANFFDEDSDLKTVKFEGEELSGLLDELSNSKIIEYGAYVAIEPILEAAGETAQALITAPQDIEWKKEFIAFGLIIDEILSTPLSLSDFETDNQQDLLSLFVDVDLTVLLESQIISKALINIFTGKTDLLDSFDFLVVPEGDLIVWEDVRDELSGEITKPGELRLILSSLNVLVHQLDKINIDNLKIQDLSLLTDDDIDELFESLIIVASISELVMNLDLGNFDLVIPDRVIDLNGYILKEEIKTVFQAMTMAASNLPCDDDDESCAELGFDMDKIISLSSDNIDTLFASDILYATTGKMLVDFDELTIPKDAKNIILVKNLNLEIITKAEIKNAFFAISALGITDIQNLTFDETILLNLSVDPDNNPTTLDTVKVNKLFASKILHATISDFIIQQSIAEAPAEPSLLVPYYASENYKDTTTNIVRYYDSIGEVDYISTNELTSVLSAILLLEIDDFTSIESLDLSIIINESEAILESAILHATISKQIRNLDGNTLIIPYKDIDNVDLLFVTAAYHGLETTYIIKSELVFTFDALKALDFTDIQNPNLDAINLESIYDQRLIIFKSAILHATVSDKIIGLSDSDTLTLPKMTVSNTLIIETVGDIPAEETQYIIKDELYAALKALNILEITDFNNVALNASILKKLSVDGQATVLDSVKTAFLFDSSIVHASISKVIFDAGQTDLSIPNFALNNYPASTSNVVIVTTLDLDKYVSELELTELLQAILILDIADFNQVASLELGDIITHSSILLESAILHATISQQVLDLQTTAADLIIPEYNDSGSLIIVDEQSPGTEKFIIVSELEALFDAMELLGIVNDIDSFTGSIDMNLFYESKTAEYDDNQNTLLSSSIMQATISQKLVTLNTTGDIVIPAKDIDDLVLEKTYGSDYFIIKTEIKALINVIDLLGGVDDIDTFNGSINMELFYASKTVDFDDNQAILLASAIMHATISKNLADLDVSGDVSIPSVDINDLPIKKLYNATDYFVVKSEIENLILVLELLNITDITLFDGAFSIATFSTDANQGVLLSSAIMHLTVSKQFLENTSILVPEKSLESNLTNLDIRFLKGTDEFISKDELKAVIKVINIISTTGDLSGFSGDISLDLFNDGSGPESNQSLLLASAIMHATISEQIISLNNGIPQNLIAPNKDIDESIIRHTVNGLNLNTEYVIKAEIRALIDGLNILGLGNQGLDSFTGDLSIASLSTEVNQDAVLLSAILHATFTNKLLGLGDDVLLVPKYTQVGEEAANQIKFEIDSVLYIDKDELKAIMNAFTDMGISDLQTIGASIDASKFFNDITLYLESASIQATLSKKILEASGSNLIIPSKNIDDSAFIRIAQTDVEYMDSSELKALIDALNILNITDFSSPVSSSVITGLSGGDIDTILISGSMHLTIDDILKGNANISSEIPAKAKMIRYALADITIKQEIKAFILATTTVSPGGDIGSISFNLTELIGLSVSDRDIVLESMIVRNILTPEIEAAAIFKLGFSFSPIHYEDGDMGSFLTKAGIEYYINY